ncbi:MAG: cyclic nucleotide-binding protein [Flavobacteriales bacterium]|nr:MAG: cyclic nucleotide-binding protein [Flavobacteriales bacterium]
MIEEYLLIQYGAKEVLYDKNEIIFEIGSAPKRFYQVVSGEIKMNNYNEDGKEFTQGIFSAGRSFGEPPLFGDFKYPANAIAITPVLVLQLSKASFFKLLNENPEISLEINSVFAKRLYYKAIMAAEISTQDAGHRILTFIDYLKEKIYKISGTHTFEVDLTRQQIADLTGLRVETVIRTVKKLAESSDIKIVKHKIFR